jgi:Ca2+-binding EF-hand superfamily protein
MEDVFREFETNDKVASLDLATIMACSGMPIKTAASLNELLDSVSTSTLDLPALLECGDRLRLMQDPAARRREAAKQKILDDLDRDHTQAIFDLFDLDHSGSVDAFELSKMLVVLGRSDISSEAQKWLMRAHGHEHEKGHLALDLDGFAALLNEVNLMRTARAQVQRRRKWMRIDILDEDGPIGIQFGVDPEIGMAIVLSTSRNGLVHKAADAPSAAVSYEDVNRVLVGDRLEVVAEGSPSELVLRPFHELDVDGDGIVSHKELRAAIAELLPRSMGSEELERAVAEVDEDGDGAISFDEFKHFVATTELDRIAQVLRTTPRPFTLVFSRPRSG